MRKGGGLDNSGGRKWETVSSKNCNLETKWEDDLKYFQPGVGEQSGTIMGRLEDIGGKGQSSHLEGSQKRIRLGSWEHAVEWEGGTETGRKKTVYPLHFTRRKTFGTGDRGLH